VILVGGPTRLPLIRKAVESYFQKPPRTDIDPDEVVAMGASIHAASLIQPRQSAFLLDVTPLSLRIGVAGGLAETVIERNTPVPIEQTRTFTTFQDFQEKVKIRVYQGESRQSEGNELLGQFEFTGFRKARRGQVEIDVTFAIDSDGLVKVTACDRATGKQASTEITLSSGLSPDELQRILEKGDGERVRTAGPEDLGPVAAAAPGVADLAGSDEIATLDEGNGDGLELESGVETPPAELRSTGIEIDGAEAAPGADADADDRDAYLDEPGGDLQPDDPEDRQA
jgi:molecular chaperone DnaK